MRDGFAAHRNVLRTAAVYRSMDMPPVPRPDWAFFLDFDGTLVEIAPDPDHVKVSPDLITDLARLQRRTGGAVALLSGRRILDLDRQLAPLRLPTGGIHGLERRRHDGTTVLTAKPGSVPVLDQLRPAIDDFAQQHPGLLVEDKGMSIALHYRHAPQFQAAVHSFTDELVLPYEEELRLVPGKMVVELQPRGADKGRAIRAFMTEPPFFGRFPVFVGDDVTDEDGFRAVNSLGGLSLRIGDARPSEARARLPSVGALHRWLAQAAGEPAR